MGIGRGLGGRFFQRIGAQARPIVKLLGLDERPVEKVGRCVLISVIDKQPRLMNWTLPASSAIFRARTLSPPLLGVFQSEVVCTQP
jgi:hypothetical protein